MSTILKYFKPIVKSALLSPEGPLSHDMPSSSIEAANKSVIAIVESEEGAIKQKRGSYEKYSPKEKAIITNYEVLHGTSAAIRHFKSKHPDLKWTTVNDWKKVIVQIFFTNLRFIHEIIITKILFPGKSTAITKICNLGNLRPYGIQ